MTYYKDELWYAAKSEDDYYDRFRTGRQAKDIWKYIPQKVME